MITTTPKFRTRVERHYWQKAIAFIVSMNGQQVGDRAIRFNEAMRVARRRFPVTSRRPGFWRAANRTWWLRCEIPRRLNERLRRAARNGTRNVF